MNNEPKSYTSHEFIHHFSSVFQYVRIYTLAHQLSKEKIRDLHEYLKDYFIHTRQDRFIFGVVMGELVAGKEILIDLSKVLSGFIALLNQRNIEKIAIENSITLEELEKLIDILINTELYPVETPFSQWLKTKNITHVQTGILATDEGEGTTQEPSAMAPTLTPSDQTARYYSMFINAISMLIEKVFNQYADDKDCTMFVNLVDQLGQHMDQDFESLFRIFGYLKTRNNYEYIHSAHVAILTVIQARSLNFDKSLVSRIGVAAFLHDVGKLSIPLEILNKPSGLSQEEFALMKSHPVRGAQILTKYTEAFGMLPVIVSFQHHLKHNGGGYPENLKYGKEIHLISRMTAIADVYDALRSSRAYRVGIPSEKVYEMMLKDKGTAFDPFLLDNFFKLVGIWSPGTVVQLNNGLVGIVQGQHAEFPDRPVVEIFYDCKENRQVDKYPLNLDQERTVSITKSLTMEEVSQQKIPIPESYVI